MFEQMMKRIREATVEYVFKVQVAPNPRMRQRPKMTEKRSELPKQINEKENNLNESKKIGRNDPCPCGSNKKYKKCCGRT